MSCVETINIDTEISILEKQISENPNMGGIDRMRAHVTSLKIKKQHLLSAYANTAPTNLTQQIEALDDQIDATEKAATANSINPGPLYLKLTGLKLQKQRLLSMDSSMPGVRQ